LLAIFGFAANSRESRVRRPDNTPYSFIVVDNQNSYHDAIRACLGQPLFENHLILGLNLDKLDSHPFVGQVMVTLPTAEKFALEFEIFRLTLVPLGEGP